MIPGFYVAVVLGEAARMANTPAIRSNHAARAMPKGSRSLLCAGNLLTFIPSRNFCPIFCVTDLATRPTGTPVVCSHCERRTSHRLLPVFLRDGFWVCQMLRETGISITNRMIIRDSECHPNKFLHAKTIQCTAYA